MTRNEPLRTYAKSLLHRAAVAWCLTLGAVALAYTLWAIAGWIA